MAKKKSSAYWKKRFLALEKASNVYGQNAYRQIEPAFDKALREIELQIEAWYGRFADNNQVTMQESRRLLNASELKELQWDIQEYIMYGQENAVNEEWIKELENASAKFHISRLEALKLRTQQAVEVAFGNEQDYVDTMARKVFTEGYYHSIFEVQKALNLGWAIGQIDERKLEKFIVKPWAADGKNFSDRIWEQKAQLISELHNQLTRTCILGKAPDDAIRAIAKKFDVSKSQAGRLVMTEQAYFHSAAQKEAYNELDVEEFEVVATLDSHTSAICQEMDGKHFKMKDYQPGVTAPPYHPWCRSVTVPYFEDNFTGKRAARDADGKTYYVPDSMRYEDWKKQYVDSPIKVDQTVKITEKNQKKFSVDRDLVNSKKYHDKFENLTSHKAVNESIYQEAMKILEHRDGTECEDLVALDARTGKVIVRNTLSVEKGRTGFMKEQYDKFLQHKGEAILLHNHPNGSRLSYRDISTLFNNPSVIGGVAVGHDGSVHFITELKDNLNIDNVWNEVYNEYIDIIKDKILAEHHALDILYQFGYFTYKGR